MLQMVFWIMRAMPRMFNFLSLVLSIYTILVVLTRYQITRLRAALKISRRVNIITRQLTLWPDSMGLI